MADLMRRRPPRRDALNPERPSSALDAIAPVVFRTRAALFAERFARAFWPLLSLLAAGWSVAAFGALDLLGRTSMLALLATYGLAALFLTAGGLRRFRWPRRAEALARLDQDLPGRPISALLDVQASGRSDPASAAVWSAHRARMSRLARAARPVRPAPRLARRDPWALRLAALTLLLAALVFSRGDGLDPVRIALAPTGGAVAATGPSFEAWATPPAYTGRPTLYLPEVPGDRAVPLPEGTEITLRLYGEAADFDLTESVAKGDHPGLATAAEGIASAQFTMDRTGSVTLREGETTLGAWSFVLEPDQPPEIALTEPVSRETGGATSIAWAAKDDYGVTGARAELSLDLPRVDRRYGLAVEPTQREPLAVDLPMPLTGERAEVADTLVEDFSKHPWAGLPVRLALAAEDAIGQQGSEPDIETVLPGRSFYDPVAAALVEQRRDLLWSPENARRVAMVLRAVTHRPEDAFEGGRAYLLTRTAIRWLERADAEDALGPQVIEEVAETLWQAALILEEGGLGDAAERLARAQERLQEALRGDASDEEIAELMEELREATRAYMQRLAEEALERDQTEQAQSQNGQEMSADQIQELMDRIQELSEQGRRAEAEQLLEMLRQMLENMEMRLAQGGQGQGQGGPGQQMMDDLAETLRDQQDLADESFQQLQREFRQNRMGQGGGRGQPGQPGEDGQAGEGTSPEDLARRQEELRQMLDSLRQSMPGAQGEAGEVAREALREAEREMGEARDSLRSGDTSGALDNQADAIEQMREGMRGLGEEMRQAGQGDGGNGAEGGDAFSDSQADPLGRPLGARGSVDTGGRMLPEGDARARARELLDEIRRRAGDLSRPNVELDYLRRLLDRF
jgi:uncharacterized protein (TIGR02302 family)